MVTGAGEVAGEIDEELGSGPGVAVDDLVVVTHPEAVVPGSGQQTDQQQVGRGEVLELVDQQATAPGLGRPSGAGIGQEDLDGPVDLLVEVDRSAFGQGAPVPVEPFADPLGVGDLLLHDVRRGEPEPDGGEGADVRGDRVGVGLTPDLEDLLEEVAHPGLLEHAWPARGPELGADPQSGAVEGPDVGPFGGEDVRTPLLELIGGTRVVGEGAHRAPVDSAVGHQMTQPLGQHPGLARAGRGDHPGRAGGVHHGGQLVRSQFGVGRTMGGRVQVAGLDAPAVDHPRPRGDGRWIGWSAVDKERRAVGPGQVGLPALGDAETGEPAGRLPAVPPDGLAAAGVVIVGPHQEVEPLHRELEGRREAVDRAVVALGGTQGVLRGGELDHQGPSLEPRRMEEVGDLPGIGQLGVAHLHPGARCPRFGHRAAGQHDDAPAEFGWSGVRHPPNIGRRCDGRSHLRLLRHRHRAAPRSGRTPGCTASGIRADPHCGRTGRRRARAGARPGARVPTGWGGRASRQASGPESPSILVTPWSRPAV